MPRVGPLPIAGLSALFAGCSLLVDVPAVQGQGEDVRRKRVEITSPLETQLEDHTVAIILDEDPDVAARGAFDNITFFDQAGSRLPSEMERYAADGSLLAWVRLPVLLSNDDGPTVVMMHYGGAPVEASPLADVWPPPFAGVWHLAGAGPEYLDSSGGGNTAVGFPPDVPESLATVIGNGLMFDGDASLTIEDPASGALDFGTESFTYSMWIQVNAAPVDTLPWVKGGVPASRAGYAIQIGPDDWHAVVSDGIEPREVDFGGAPFGPWTLVAAVVDRGAGTITPLLDGDTFAADGDAAGLGAVGSSEDAVIGQGFVGQLDEIRVSRGVTPAEAFYAEAVMYTSSELYYAAGGEEELP